MPILHYYKPACVVRCRRLFVDTESHVLPVRATAAPVVSTPRRAPFVCASTPRRHHTHTHTHTWSFLEARPAASSPRVQTGGEHNAYRQHEATETPDNSIIDRFGRAGCCLLAAADNRATKEGGGWLFLPHKHR